MVTEVRAVVVWFGVGFWQEGTFWGFGFFFFFLMIRMMAMKLYIIVKTHWMHTGISLYLNYTPIKSKYMGLHRKVLTLKYIWQNLKHEFVVWNKNHLPCSLIHRSTHIKILYNWYLDELANLVGDLWEPPLSSSSVLSPAILHRAQPQTGDH